MGEHGRSLAGFAWQFRIPVASWAGKCCFSFPKHHENTSIVACDPGIFISTGATGRAEFNFHD
jgi:hypothetical protein